MKILYAFNRDLNPYVEVLISGLGVAGCPVDTGTKLFWQEDLFDYDIVHIQWPETLFDWRVPSEIELEFLRKRLNRIRSRAKVVYTRHNEVSHHANESNAPILQELYALVESECDVMVHLGEASLQSCRKRDNLVGKRHVMIPIPVYDELYAPYLEVNPFEAKKELGLHQNKKIILAFGNVRYDREKVLMTNAVSALRREICFVAPKWYRRSDYSFTLQHPMLTLRSTRKAVWAWRQGMKLGAKKIMSDEEVALHFVAADVVFIQRVNGLNSGNIPMAYLFGKVAVGPDSGNIGYWLKATMNPVFNPHDSGSIQRELSVALQMASKGMGERNRNFALSCWSTQQIGLEMAKLYSSIVNK